MNQIEQTNDHILIQLLKELWHPNNNKSISPTALEHYFYSNTSYWL